MGLIDADELKKRMCFKCNDEYSDEPCEPSDCVFCNAINDAETVDATPVVRCKDCKHHEDEEIGMVYCPNAFGGWVGENWFCADGERKEGAD